VVGWGVIDIIGFLPILKVELYVFEKRVLIPFDGEMIVRLTSDQIIGKVTLR
jgi:hypothetical protein